MRLLIAYSKDVIREGLVACLSKTPGIRMVHVCEYSGDILKKAHRLKPDIILTDGNVAAEDFSEIVKRLHEELPDTRVVIVTPFARNLREPLAYLEINADGYIDLDIDARQLSEALQQVRRGGNIICPSITQILLAREKTIDNKPKKQGFNLTDRELEVLSLVARGQTNREIAQAMFISDNTVKAHLRNVLRKMNVQTRMQAVIMATENGMIENQAWKGIAGGSGDSNPDLPPKP